MTSLSRIPLRRAKTIGGLAVLAVFVELNNRAGDLDIRYAGDPAVTDAHTSSRTRQVFTTAWRAIWFRTLYHLGGFRLDNARVLF